jgi:transposase
MKKIPKQAYTTEFKELAVKRATDVQSIPTTAKELGLSDQTLRKWIKALAEGKLSGAGSKVVTPEAMELSRLRAEVARLKVENEIRKCVHACIVNGDCAVHCWQRRR